MSRKEERQKEWLQQHVACTIHFQWRSLTDSLWVMDIFLHGKRVFKEVMEIILLPDKTWLWKPTNCDPLDTLITGAEYKFWTSKEFSRSSNDLKYVKATANGDTVTLLKQARLLEKEEFNILVYFYIHDKRAR